MNMLDDPKAWITIIVLGLWFMSARTDERYRFHIDPRYWVRKLKEEKRPTTKTVNKLLVCIGIVAILYVTIPFITNLVESASGAPIVDPEDNAIKDIADMSPLLLLFLLASLPLAEEWLFRAVLLDRLMREWSIVGGLVVSSVLFGVFHYAGNSGYSVYASVAPTCAGVVLGIVYWKMGLRWCCAVHIFYNVAIWLAVFS